MLKNHLLHSDQGWQYQMNEYHRMLKAHNITQSMSRKGNYLDNSVMENFFGRLKTEMFFGETFDSVEEFIKKLEEYIYYFNKERVSLVLNGMSPGHKVPDSFQILTLTCLNFWGNIKSFVSVFFL